MTSAWKFIARPLELLMDGALAPPDAKDESIWGPKKFAKMRDAMIRWFHAVGFKDQGSGSIGQFMDDKRALIEQVPPFFLRDARVACSEALRIELEVALDNVRTILESRNAGAPFNGQPLSDQCPSSYIIAQLLDDVEKARSTQRTMPEVFRQLQEINEQKLELLDGKHTRDVAPGPSPNKAPRKKSRSGETDDDRRPREENHEEEKQERLPSRAEQFQVALAAAKAKLPRRVTEAYTRAKVELEPGALVLRNRKLHRQDPTGF